MMSIILTLLAVGAVYGGSLNLDLQRIADRVNSLQTTWKANSDLPRYHTISSVQRLLGVRNTQIDLPIKEHDDTDIEIPEEFDARKKWPECPTISQVRDQGNCGSCWAVAVAAAFSDRVCIATNGTFTMPFSEEELLSCNKFCFGCDGGFLEPAWDFISSTGLVTGGDYNSNVGCQPYSIPGCEHHTKGDLPSCSTTPAAKTPECKKKCTNEKYENSFSDDHHRILAQGAYTLKRNVTEIQKEVLLHGPVEATFAVYSDFGTYKSGVYQHVSGAYLGGHAVKLIGWGTENGTPYWLMVNSWNTHWGEGGLFKIIRGQNECGIESGITAGIPNV